MQVHQIHVGQGHTTFITMPDGYRILIDCDCWDAVVDPIDRLKELIPADESGVRYIDLVILTHPHRDHVSGFARLSDEFEIGEVWHSGHELECDDDWYQEYVKALDTTAAIVVEASAEPLATGEGWELRVLAPVQQVVASVPDDKESRRHIHDQCIVISLREGEASILIAGDSRWVEWESRIVEEFGDSLKHDLFLAPHHGSRTFFTDDEDGEDPYLGGLEAISPRVVMVAVGENNHDHPHEDALAIYSGSSKVFRTDEWGTLVAESDDTGWVIGALLDTDGEPESDPQEIYRDDDNEEPSLGKAAAIGALAAAAGVGIAVASGEVRRRRDQAARRRPEPPHWGV